MSPLDMSMGRHAITHAPHAPSLWKCPACDAQNAGPLEQGCTKCFSGQPGRKADVERQAAVPDLPLVDDAVVRGAAGGDLSERVQALQGQDARDAAFLAWFRPFRGKLGAEGEQIIYAAFVAGAQWVEGRVVNGTTAGSGAADTLVGTAKERTIIAALRLFVEQILSQRPEEVATGEWLSAEETLAVVKEMERTQ